MPGSIWHQQLTTDASSGFHQISLDRESCHLTTFIKPFGKYCFQRVPFGITSAPEIFQRRMSEILADIDGADAIMDDIIVYGQSTEEHVKRPNSGGWVKTRQNQV